MRRASRSILHSWSRRLARSASGALTDEKSAAGCGLADVDILRDRERFQDINFLGHVTNPAPLRIVRRAKFDIFSVDDDPPLIGSGGINAVKNFHQRAFARAIFPHERVDVAALHLDGDTAQRLDAGELFYDVVHLQRVFHVL